MGAGAWQAIAQGVTDIASSALGQWQANKAAKRAWRQYKHRYSKTVEDLYRAKLNPILALGGTGGISAGQQPGIGDVVDGRSSAAQTWINAKVAEAQIRNTDANTVLANFLGNKADSDAYLANAQASKILQEIPWISDKMKAEIANLGANSALTTARRQAVMAEMPQIMFRSTLGGSTGPLLDSGIANSAIGLLKVPRFEKTFNIERNFYRR